MPVFEYVCALFSVWSCEKPYTVALVGLHRAIHSVCDDGPQYLGCIVGFTAKEQSMLHLKHEPDGRGCFVGSIQSPNTRPIEQWSLHALFSFSSSMESAVAAADRMFCYWSYELVMLFVHGEWETSALLDEWMWWHWREEHTVCAMYASRESFQKWKSMRTLRRRHHRRRHHIQLSAEVFFFFFCFVCPLCVRCSY